MSHVRIKGAPLMDFTYVSVGVGPLPMRLGLNLKHAHENWDQHKAVMHVLANKAHVNTWVIMCKQ
jgi:hypothetical protein